MNRNLKTLGLLNQIAQDPGTKAGPVIIHYWGHISGHSEHHLHKHSFFESCYVIEGSGVYTDNGVDYILTPGSLFLSYPGVFHKICGTPTVSLLWVAFEPAKLESHDQLHPLCGIIARLLEPFRIFIASDETSLTSVLWKALLADADLSSTFMKESFSGISLTLIASFADRFCTPLLNPAPVQLFGSHSVLLHQAKLLIRDNLSQKIRLPELADFLHISERQLSRLFQLEEGQSYTEFYRKERVKSVCQMLIASSDSLEKIAMETGFYSVHHMSRVFKEQLGVTPGSYRKQLLYQK